MIKKNKSIFILLLIALLCIAFYVYLIPRLFDKEGGQLFELKSKEQIVSIELSNEYGNFYFYKGDNKWTVSSKKTYRTNEKKMKLFIDALKDFSYSRKMEEDNGEYGLDNPSARVVFFTNKDKKHKFSVGNMTASQNDVYIRDDSTNQLYIVSNTVVAQLTGSLAAYRDNEVFMVDINQIETLEYFKEEQLQIALTTEGEIWHMQYPYKQLARKVEMQEFMDMISGWTIAGYPMLTEKDYENVGLETPKETLVIKDRKGNSQTISFGKSDGNITYVQVGEKQEVVGLYTADIDLSRLTGDTLVYVAPLKVPITEIESIMVQGEDHYNFEIQDTEQITCNERNIDAAQFERIFYKYVSLIASGGETSPIKLEENPLITLTSTYKNKKTTTVELYERDEKTYYMDINGTVQFYTEKTRVEELLLRIHDCLGR